MQGSDTPVITGLNGNQSSQHQQQQQQLQQHQRDLDLSLQEHSITESQSLQQPQQQQQQQHDLDLSLPQHSISGLVDITSLTNRSLNQQHLTSQPLLDITSTGDSTVYLETPDRRRETEEAHRLFTKIKFILDTTRDEQNLINNQLKFLKENLVLVPKIVLLTEDNIKKVIDLPSDDKEEGENDDDKRLVGNEESQIVEWEDLAHGLLNQDAKVYIN